jgi:hypothetical protein
LPAVAVVVHFAEAAVVLEALGLPLELRAVVQVLNLFLGWRLPQTTP